MAKIIKKGYQLEDEYYAKELEQAKKSVKNWRKLCKSIFVFIIIYVAFIIGSVIADIILIAFIPLTVGFGFALLIIVLMYFCLELSEQADTDILVSGIQGERIATEVLATLPDSYIVFQNTRVTFEDKKSEIDNIIVGKSGVFIVEVKNHNGHIVGDIKDTHWEQNKVGRGGTAYTNSIYNPVKQVGTHIYYLANYLRQNGVNTYIEGMVYFTNKSCLVSLSGQSAIAVYSSSDCDEERLCRRILSGDHKLDLKSVNEICKLINQL